MSLLITVNGFRGTSEILTRWWYARRHSLSIGQDAPGVDPIEVTLSFMTLGLGVSLFFGARGFVRLFHWARVAGPARGAPPAGGDEA